MKGNPFKLNYSKDGSFRITSKRGYHETIESKYKREYFEKVGIKNLDELRPDGYKDGIWYEAKVGSEMMIVEDWIKGSEYFPELYFPPYYFEKDDIDGQIERYINYGYCPLRVIVFDYYSGNIIRCITVSCENIVNGCQGGKA